MLQSRLHPGPRYLWAALLLAAVGLSLAAGCSRKPQEKVEVPPTSAPATAKPVTEDFPKVRKRFDYQTKCTEVPPSEQKLVPADSGLKVQELCIGLGDKAEKGDTVHIDYTLYLDKEGKPGKEVYNSAKLESAFMFTAGGKQVMTGLSNGVLGMFAGGRRYLIIPAEQAYGGVVIATEGIPANATLHAMLTLLRVEKLESLNTARSGADPVPEVNRELIVLREGLSYKDLTLGKGGAIEPDRGVRFHYTVYLDDKGQPGKVAMTSKNTQPEDMIYGSGHPIKHMDRLLEGIREGGTRRAWVSAELAYGKEGYAPNIPPDADLIYDIEVLIVGGKGD